MILRKILLILPAIAALSLLSPGCNRDEPEEYGTLQLVRACVGTACLDAFAVTDGVPADKSITIEFSSPLDTSTVQDNLGLEDEAGNPVVFATAYADALKTIVLTPEGRLSYRTGYTLTIHKNIRGARKETFPGMTYAFSTMNGILKIEQITLNGQDFNPPADLKDIDFSELHLDITFSDPLDRDTYQSFFILSGNPSLAYNLSGDSMNVTILNTADLNDYTRYYFTISSSLRSNDDYEFGGFSNSFFTSLDSTYKFPALSDEELLDLVQKQTLKYFYDFSHPLSGMARERNTSGNTVTSGGSGFGLMALIVGMERGFITRTEGLSLIERILDFLETCDRFHGAWPHWLNGATGTVQPFSQKDDGADLVETAFMVQGLITLRQYLDESSASEKDLISRIDTLWHGVEWDWFTRGGQDVLYWHWSPDYGWEMNMPIRGYNEALIVYVLAASSPTHTIPPSVYHEGYARNGAIVNGNSFYDITLPLGYDFGGPLFFAHYSFLGLDPRNLADQYASYLEQNVSHTLINRMHCIRNPNGYTGYSRDCWGLTASDGNQGYSAHSPTNDRGVITPTAALSSMPFTPGYSMDALKHFYYLLGDKCWGEYGFYDAFNISENWWADSYIAIDQGPIIVMIENYRSGLLWELFMSAPEVQAGLTKLGFTY
ncbi:MAG: Ig-like domain-containing protein [Bacteroidales bacterium]|nr:Ig-like domain-containing protein [Bacteroidales bacterium]MBN2698824.1 Ig-like domain-containing protein [Bacteroidales bacterium]